MNVLLNGGITGEKGFGEGRHVWTILAFAILIFQDAKILDT